MSTKLLEQLTTCFDTGKAADDNLKKTDVKYRTGGAAAIIIADIKLWCKQVRGAIDACNTKKKPVLQILEHEAAEKAAALKKPEEKAK